MGVITSALGCLFSSHLFCFLSRSVRRSPGPSRLERATSRQCSNAFQLVFVALLNHCEEFVYLWLRNAFGTKTWLDFRSQCWRADAPLLPVPFKIHVRSGGEKKNLFIFARRLSPGDLEAGLKTLRAASLGAVHGLRFPSEEEFHTPRHPPLRIKQN